MTESFKTWLKEHEKHKPVKGHKDDCPKGVRNSGKEDLSKDYPPNLDNMGKEYPFKVLKK